MPQHRPMSALPALAHRPVPESAARPADDWSSPEAGWTEPLYPPTKIDVVAQVLATAGMPAAELLAGTGVDGRRLQDPDYRTSTAQLYAVLRRAVQLHHGPGLGRRIGTRLRITAYGLYGYALLSAPTMRAAMERATRFHALANPLVPIRGVVGHDTVAWQFPTRHELMLPELDERLYRVLIELQMATHHTLSQDVMGAWCHPTFVGLGWPQPRDGDDWAASFGVAASFAQPRCELRYPAVWLERAPQLANVITAAQTSRECARLLASLEGGASLARRVYRELMHTPGRFPGIESIATTLGMTGRTLRRRLQAEGTSYADMLTRVRRALAEDYLRGTRMSVDDIAAALAFSDGRSFRQAFARWTGCSPSEFRRAPAPGG
jgi:AraC-like DNA-binding protein